MNTAPVFRSHLRFRTESRVGLWLGCIALTSGSGCYPSRTDPPAVLRPNDAPGVRSWFVHGRCLATIETPGALALAALEPVGIGHEKYARLWLLVHNRGDAPFLLDPSEGLRLTTQDSGWKQQEPNYTWGWSADTRARGLSEALSVVAPVPPTKLLDSWMRDGWYRDRRSIGLDFVTLGSPIDSRPSGIPDRLFGVDRDPDPSQVDGASMQTWIEAFHSSEPGGLLRRHTLFPKQTVDGCAFFRVPAWETEEEFLREARYRYAVWIDLPGGEKTVRFAAVGGE